MNVLPQYRPISVSGFRVESSNAIYKAIVHLIQMLN